MTFLKKIHFFTFFSFFFLFFFFSFFIFVFFHFCHFFLFFLFFASFFFFFVLLFFFSFLFSPFIRVEIRQKKSVEEKAPKSNDSGWLNPVFGTGSFLGLSAGFVVFFVVFQRF